MRLRVQARDLQPGDTIAATGERVDRVSKSKLTPQGRIDVWLDRRHALWRPHKFIEVERSS